MRMERTEGLIGMDGNDNRKSRGGFSLIELLIVIAIILILVAIAIPRLSSARRSAYELASIRACQTINTAQVQYFSTFSRYATTLSELGPPPGSTSSSASAADLIPESLAAGVHQGYVYTMIGTPAGYSVNADPTAFEVTGSRTFYTDHSTVVRQHYGNQPATENDPTLQ